MQLPTKSSFFSPRVAGILIAELNKVSGRPMELALDAGEYHVLRDLDRELSESHVTLAVNQHLLASELAFTHVEGELNPTRGEVDPETGRFRRATSVAADALRDSYGSLEFWNDDMAYLHVSLDVGQPQLYLILDLSLQNTTELQQLALSSTGFGVGSRYSWSNKYLSLEGLRLNYGGDSVYRAQVSFGVNFAANFWAFAGPSYSFANDRIPAPTHFSDLLSIPTDENTKTWLGAQLGVRYDFN